MCYDKMSSALITFDIVLERRGPVGLRADCGRACAAGGGIGGGGGGESGVIGKPSPSSPRLLILPSLGRDRDPR